ncbi:MAG: hypothetical protein AAF357_08215 [Verrucomicrobiota bacterium]
MDVGKALAEEHSRELSELIADWIGVSTARFEILRDILMGENPVLARRASRALASSAEKYPQVIEPHLGALLENLASTDLPDAIKRHTLRAAADCKIPDSIFGLAADTALAYLTSPNESVATRAQAMRVLEQLCLRQEALIPEVRMAIEEQLNFCKRPGFTSKARQVLSSLNRREQSKATTQ